MFEMLAGRPPFLGDTLASVIHAVVYAPTPSLRELAPETPPAIVAAVERALSKSRDERFPDVGGFVKAVTARSVETAPTMAAAPARRPAAPPAVATERVVRGRSFPILPAILGLALLGGGAWLVMGRTPAPAPAPAPIAPPPPVAIKPAEPPSPVAIKMLAPPPPPVAVKAVDPPPSPPTPTPTTKTAAKQETLSPAAASDLAEADAALGAGKSTDAIRLAQHSLYTQKSSRAYGIIARARCAEGDLGNAKAALAQVAPRDRAAVVRACGKVGVELH